MDKNPQKNSVTAHQLDWSLACAAAAEEDKQFLTFRKSLAFLRVVEGTPKEAGYWNLKRLLDSELFVKALPELQLSDSVGLPSNLVSFHVAGFPYSLSPTTIRYANNAVNCLDLFGLRLFRNGVIHEIGGVTAEKPLCSIIFQGLFLILIWKTVGVSMICQVPMH